MQSTYAFITVKEARWSKINHQILIKLLKMFFFGGGGHKRLFSEEKFQICQI